MQITGSQFTNTARSTAMILPRSPTIRRKFAPLAGRSGCQRLSAALLSNEVYTPGDAIDVLIA